MHVVGRLHWFKRVAHAHVLFVDSAVVPNMHLSMKPHAVE